MTECMWQFAGAQATANVAIFVTHCKSEHTNMHKYISTYIHIIYIYICAYVLICVVMCVC